jgi:hypothetical protein
MYAVIPAINICTHLLDIIIIDPPELYFQIPSHLVVIAYKECSSIQYSLLVLQFWKALDNNSYISLSPQ